MYCPKCKKNTKIIDSRPLQDRNGIRRRRQCLNCGHRFTTYEEYENSENITDLKELHEKLKRGKAILNMAQDVLKGNE